MPFHRRLAAVLLGAAALAPLAGAHAADCAGTSAGTLATGQAVRVEPGPARSYALELAAGQGIIVDLASLAPPAPKASGDGDEHEHAEDAAKTPPRDLMLCSTAGTLLAPMAGEVFEKGSSVSVTPDGQRLRFVAPANGRYTLWVAASGDAREVIARGRDLGKGGGAVRSAQLGAEVQGRASSTQTQIFSFAGTAGQWVELKAVSESDTVLNLAGPDRSGAYSVIANNDDSEGLNPRIRRRLPVTGTYYVQVDSLAENLDDFTLSLKAIAAPPPPPPPAALRAGTEVSAKLNNQEDVRVYNLAVQAGRSYRLELTAGYDGVVAIGVPSPIEADDGKDGPAAGFAEIKAQDTGTTGTERLTFTARSNGTVTVMVRSFGIGETDGSYTLKATDLGG